MHTDFWDAYGIDFGDTDLDGFDGLTRILFPPAAETRGIFFGTRIETDWTDAHGFLGCLRHRFRGHGFRWIGRMHTDLRKRQYCNRKRKLI